MTAPFRLSPSQAETYDRCPRQYAFERRLGAGDTFSPYAHYGSLIHLVLELSEARAIDIQQPHNTLSETLEILDQVWASDADFGSPVLNDAWKAKGRALLTKMHENWPGGNCHPHSHRKELRARNRRDQMDRSGRSDRTPSGRAAAGHRLQDRLPAADVPEASESLQLGFYLLAAAADPDLAAHGRPTEAEFWHPAASSTNPVRKFDPANLELVESKLRTIGAGIAAEAWPATPGVHCRYCSVRLICPAWPEGREAFV